MKVRTRARWQNTIHKYKVNPVKYFEPESLADIVSIIKEAELKNFRVRAVGTGHSFSDVAVTNQYLVDLCRLQEVKLYDAAVVKEEHKSLHLVNGQAGIRLRDLNRKLDTMNLALINMGGIDLQKLAGVISTGTHGSGKDLPAIHGFVHSILLAGAGGKIYRIEKTNGITDPAKFMEADAELIQDDKIFYSVLLSFGSMGIIHSLVIEVVPLYYLRETKLATNWDELKKNGLTEAFLPRAMMNPAAHHPVL